MYILQSWVWEDKNFLYNFWFVDSFGVYWRKKLLTFFSIKKKYSLLVHWEKKLCRLYLTIDLIYLRFLVLKFFFSVDLMWSSTLIFLQIKKLLKNYIGIRLELGLPARGQWTRTNASTQRRLVGWLWKRHFVQYWNWRKFMSKVIVEKKLDFKKKDKKKRLKDDNEKLKIIKKESKMSANKNKKK